MIRIQQLGELTEYVFSAYETTGAYHLYPCFILAASDPIHAESYGSRPSSLKQNMFGDHDCYHDNLSGTLSIVPTKATGNELSPVAFTSYNGGTGKEQEISVSHLLMWGEAGEIPMRIDPTIRYNKDYYKRMRIFVSYPHADAVLISLYDPPWGSSGGYVTYYLTTIGMDQDGKRCVNGSSQGFRYSGSMSNAPKCTLSPNYNFVKGSALTYLKNHSPSVSLSPDDISSITNFVGHIIPSINSKEVWGELSYKAANQAKALDINSIAYLQDLLKTKETVMSTINILKAKPSLRKIADLELSYKYGLRLTYNDTITVLKSLERKVRSYLGSSIIRSQMTTAWVSDIPGTNLSVQGTTRCNLKCYYDSCDSGIVSLLRKSMSADIFPTLQNAWDLVPLSFVLDWFVDVSSLLDRIDSNTLISTLSVMSVIRTTRSQFVIDAQLVPRLKKLGLQGNLTYVRYDRRLTNHLTPPLPRFDGVSEFHNFVELGAIIVQKRR